MALRSELSELLAGFEKRMKFIHIVRSLLDYSYPDSIRKMIPDRDVLDNIIVAVLVFIKERTLGSDKSCTMGDVVRFLEDFSEILPSYEIDAELLARYIIVDVLQNSGVLMEYLTYYSGDETFRKMPVRLIAEDKGRYHLTDDAFDFLFRSKEIESELDYSVTRFRMQEYMKRDNYVEARDQSRELVNRIRNMKTSMNDFLIRCRENMSRITVDQYDNVIFRFRALLESEYHELSEIQKNAEKRAAKLREAGESGADAKETEKRRDALREIIHNISLTIDEQRSLINQKNNLSDAYAMLLRDRFKVSRFERMHFEKDVLEPLKKMGDALGDAARFLLFPLTKPEFENLFSIENFYAPQGKISEDAHEEGLDMTETEDDGGSHIIEARNERFRNICCDFFRFAAGKERFCAGEFIESLRVSELCEYCEENSLPNALLSMYAMQELDIAGWRQSEEIVITPMGDFELAWCLSGIPSEYLQMDRLILRKIGKNCEFTVRRDDSEYRVAMSDFEVEVIR